MEQDHTRIGDYSDRAPLAKAPVELANPVEYLFLLTTGGIVAREVIGAVLTTTESGVTTTMMHSLGKLNALDADQDRDRRFDPAKNPEDKSHGGGI